MSEPNSGLWITNPGISATIQDMGRKGFRQHGLAVGGALDLHAFHWANRLLGNPIDAACLEILVGGFRATAETDIAVALTGADAPVTVNRKQFEHWRTLELNAGDELDIGYSRSGRILYLALPGGIDSPLCFGSRSVAPREQIFGLSPMTAESRLMPARSNTRIKEQITPVGSKPDYRKDLTLRLIPSYQYADFTRDDLLRLTTRDYTITQQSDRMGFRLDGPELKRVPPGIISEGIATGAVQIPGDGQPIVLMNDCQTIGGYPKPGVIASLDCHRLAQRLPGQTVRFAFTDIADAQNERRLFNRFFHGEHLTD